MHKICKPYAFALLLIASISVAAAEPVEEDPCQYIGGPELPNICFSGAVLQASQIALMRFQSDQPSAALENFFILAEEFDTYIEISFLVNQDPIETGIKGDTAYITIPNPHGNQYGRNVSYQIAKEGGEVLKVTYSK